MIQIELRTIVDNIEIFNEFSRKNMPAAAAYKAARILGRLTDEFNLYQKSRTALIEKYCDRNEDGTMKTDGDNAIIKPENVAQCEKELQDLMNTKIELNVTPLTLAEVEHLEFTPAQMYMLKDFIEE